MQRDELWPPVNKSAIIAREDVDTEIDRSLGSAVAECRYGVAGLLGCGIANKFVVI